MGHLARECPLPSKPWCTHCRVHAHATEECPEFIAKWEDRARQRSANLVNSELRQEPFRQQMINIITQGGTRTRADTNDPNPFKIKKVEPKNLKFDPVQHKDTYKEAA